MSVADQGLIWHVLILSQVPMREAGPEVKEDLKAVDRHWY